MKKIVISSLLSIITGNSFAALDVNPLRGQAGGRGNEIEEILAGLNVPLDAEAWQKLKRVEAMVTRWEQEPSAPADLCEMPVFVGKAIGYPLLILKDLVLPPVSGHLKYAPVLSSLYGLCKVGPRAYGRCILDTMKRAHLISSLAGMRYDIDKRIFVPNADENLELLWFWTEGVQRLTITDQKRFRGELDYDPAQG